MNDILNFFMQHLYLTAPLLGVTVALIFLEQFKKHKQTLEISPAQLIDYMNHKKATVIDVRSKEDYNAGHIISALCLNADDLNPTSSKLDPYRTHPLILVCAAGLSAMKIAEPLKNAGLTVYTLQGGLKNWRAANMPLVKE